MSKPVYVVTMYRWGDRECHSYVLGVFSTKTKACKAAQAEKDFRGGNKYYPEVLEVPVDFEREGVGSFKVILELERNKDFT